VLEQLEFSCDEGPYGCLSLENLNPPVENRPVVVQRCVFQGKRSRRAGLLLSGRENYQTPLPSGFVAIRDNAFAGFQHAIYAIGSLHNIHIVGNRIWGATMGGLQLENLMPGTENILVANNTFFSCMSAFRLWDAAVKGKNIHLHNNLTLASPQADMVFIDSGGDPAKVRGPGDGALLLKNWYLSHNWRETKPPTGTSYLEKSWIPPGPQDLCRDDIPVLSRNPEEANFLRPAKDSPLAKAGAGRDLPTYVGAVPPEGVQAWDWQKTWNARMRKFPEKKGKTGKE